MSFLIELRREDLDPDRARALARSCTAAEHLAVTPWPPRRPWRPRPHPVLLISPESADGRHLLTDAADWAAPTWDTDPEVAGRLAATLACLLDELVLPAVFFAGWVGEEEHERTVGRAELLERIRSNRLESNTRYRIVVGRP